MTFFLVVLLMSVVPLNGLALWAFVRFRPEESPGAKVFDTLAFTVIPILCVLFCFWVHTSLNGRVEQQWLAFFAALAWPASFPVLLTIAGSIRNLIFRPPVRA